MTQSFKDTLKYWKRFFDDCFVPWTKSEEELIKFYSVLNNLHNDIRLTLEYNQNMQSFLDVNGPKQSMKSRTDIFFTEFDSKQYMLFSSCHRRHTKINISYNLAHRLKQLFRNKLFSLIE